MSPLLASWFTFASILFFWLTPLASAQQAVPAGAPVAGEADPLRTAQIANQTAQADYYRHQLSESHKPDLPPWLNAALPVIGLVAGSVLTYLVAKRQAAEERKRLYERQKAQVYIAAQDLQRTLDGLDLRRSVVLPFFQAEFLVIQPQRPTLFSSADPYYQKYDLVDLIYRLCALLGWMELYRNDPGFLNGPATDRHSLATSFRSIRSALSRREESSGKQGDGVILEDDQRAIGEVMLTTATKETPPTVLGYGAFCSTLFRFAVWDEHRRLQLGEQNYWIWNATRFVVDMGQRPAADDGRRARLLEVLKELKQLSDILRAEKPE